MRDKKEGGRVDKGWGDRRREGRMERRGECYFKIKEDELMFPLTLIIINLTSCPIRLNYPCRHANGTTLTQNEFSMP